MTSPVERKIRAWLGDGYPADVPHSLLEQAASELAKYHEISDRLRSYTQHQSRCEVEQHQRGTPEWLEAHCNCGLVELLKRREAMELMPTDRERPGRA